jgi:hypothetical protein
MRERGQMESAILSFFEAFFACFTILYFMPLSLFLFLFHKKSAPQLDLNNIEYEYRDNNSRYAKRFSLLRRFVFITQRVPE